MGRSPAKESVSEPAAARDRVTQAFEQGRTAAQPTLTPREFAKKWGDNATKESAAAKEHFIDLCRMLGNE